MDKLIYIPTFAFGILATKSILITAAQNFLIYPRMFKNYVPAKQNISDFVMKINENYLHFYKLDNKTTKKLIIYFHGNDGYLPMYSNVLAQLNIVANVVSFDYRGYGISKGKPSQYNLIQDGKSIIRYFSSFYDEIYVVGHSLGGSVAVHSVDDKIVKGLVLENTFTSIKDVVCELYPKYTIYPWLANTALLRSPWNSEKQICQLKLPILFVSGKNDEIISPKLMKKLSKAYQGQKKFVELDGMHNNTWKDPNYLVAIKNFIESHI
eukprot:NODE_63_length_26141_cov_1.022656.p13 type:complete len:266 gc:universal NODE_63_length_26141_cov_1.022656:15229-16026(+)